MAFSKKLDFNTLINNRLLTWSLFFILSYCTLTLAELEPKDEEDTKPTLVILLFVNMGNLYFFNIFQQPNPETTSNTVVENVGFLHAFVASLSVILVSEIGDKTFFIAAIMAMRHPRLIVFGGAISALALMTVLSGKLRHFSNNITYLKQVI